MAESESAHIVTTDELAAQLDDGALRVFDCTVAFEQTPQGVRTSSGRAGWEEGRIPGAGFLDLLEDLSDPDNALPAMLPPAAQFADVLGRAGVGPGARVVLYDRGGAMWAARIWWMLRCYGFDDAAVLSGGFGAWTAEGRPVSTEPPAYPPATFEARPRAGLMAGKDDVRAAIDADGVLLMNALPPPVHAGEVAPYGRPGCIPGSCNVPAQAVLDEAGRFRTLLELRALFEQSGAFSADRVIAYCGGGVSACSDAFVLTLLGHPNVAVYDGSLADWAGDPSCPMECADG